MASNVRELGRRKPSQAERLAKVADPVRLAVAADRAEGKPTPPAPIAAKPDTPAEVAPKKKRNWSAHHLAWKATPDFKDEQRIVVLSADNPKKRGAATRFALYKRGSEGMTVGEYIEISHKAGNAKALAKEDVKWDWTAGFISVDGVKAPPNIRAAKA